MRHKGNPDGSSDDSDSDASRRSDRSDQRRGSENRGGKNGNSPKDDEQRCSSRRNSENNGSGREGRDKDNPSDHGDGDDRKGRSRRRDDSGRRKSSRDSSTDDSPAIGHHHSCSHRHKHYIKPKEFSGETSFETFMVSFANAAKFNRWDAEEKLADLRASLTGIAAQLLWGTDDLTYDQLVKKLEDRFGTVGMEERFQAELQCRRRRPGEPIRELAQDIRRLMSLAFPGEDDTGLGQHILKDYFVSALDDPVLQMEVRKNEPRTFEKAVRLALRYEITKAAVEASSSSSRHRVSRRIDEIRDEAPLFQPQASGQQHQEFDDLCQPAVELGGKSQFEVSKTDRRSPRRKEKRARATDRTSASAGQAGMPPSLPDLPQLNEVVKRFQEMEATVRQERAELAAKLDVMSKRLERYERFEQGRTQNAPRPAPNQGQAIPPPVQRTAQSGSGQREFPNSGPSGMSFGQREASRPTLSCWKCGQPGHLFRNCPLHMQEGTPPPPPNQANSNGARSITGDPTPRQREQPRQFRVSKVSKSNSGSGSYPPSRVATYLRARINGCDQECLLDTGSEVTVVPAFLVNKGEIRQSNQALKAANETEIKIIGEVTLPITTTQFKSTVHALVTEHVSEVLLGADWLTENKASWNFEDSSINLSGRRHKLSTRPKGQTWCRRIVVQTDTVAVSYTHLTLPTILRV